MDRYRFSEDQMLIIEHSPVPFAVYQFLDKRVVTIALSGGFLKMLGCTLENKKEAYRLMDENMYEGTHPDDAARVAEAALRFASEGGRYEEIYRSRNNAESSYKIIHAIGEHYFTSTGERLATVWYMDEGEYNGDLGSEQKDTLKRIFTNAMREESMIHANNYDYLTGLPSMTYFFELAEAGRLKILRQDLNPVMLFFDLNGMKYYNSKYGFAEGDRLLISFAKLLAEFFSNENCCRVGQDHFAAYTDDAGIREKLDYLFSRWEDSGNASVLPVRVGIYRDDMEEVNGSLACDRAKYACDSIRNIYGSCYTFFDEEMLTAAQNRQYILDNFDRALEERWIEVWFQPIVRTTNGRICDEEALSRWNDPVYGMLSPAQFIPILEDAGVIYKLDLYVVDRVIEVLLDLKENSIDGINIVPQSINLSRTDFRACDIIEEITKRVDAAGLDHSLFTIELTESAIGSDYDYMKDQVDRFRELGFPVWMDDFGSGYSSLELIQRIRFDLIKFDMSFMQQYDSGYGSKVILTELMRMTAALGIESLCEGVEREEQVDFLREIGCSKIQGFFYGRPEPEEVIEEKFKKGKQTLAYEDPEQSGYFETIGRINLHDLSAIADKDDSDLQQYFNGLPMAMIEILGDKVRFVRSNQSYRDFMEGYLGMTVTGKHTDYVDTPDGPLRPFMEQLRSALSYSDRAVIDTSVGSTSVHTMVRRITENPVSGASAVVTTILTVADDVEGTTYENIARALAADYIDLYYVNLDTEEFIEYTSVAGEEKMADERHGTNFFEEARSDALKYMHEADGERFANAFTKERVLKALNAQGSFNTDYRLIVDGEPIYMNMKVVRMYNNEEYAIVAISNVDAQMRQRRMLDQLKQEQATYSRIRALTGDFIVMYLVDPETDSYIESNASGDYSELGLAERGENFFKKSIEDGKKTISPQDIQMYLETFTRENVYSTIERNGLFVMKYHLMINGEPKLVKLRAAMSDEVDGKRLIIGVNYITD